MPTVMWPMSVQVSSQARRMLASGTSGGRRGADVGTCEAGRTSLSCNQVAILDCVYRRPRYPGETLWLYGDADPFYPLSHSRDNFAAFQAAGGKGAFHEFAPPSGATGHQIVQHPAVWGCRTMISSPSC